MYTAITFVITSVIFACMIAFHGYEVHGTGLTGLIALPAIGALVVVIFILIWIETHED
jgi:hypothetical protein